MNATPPESDDSMLRECLRAAKPSPALPPRFVEHVWRRIETGDARGRSFATPNWLEAVTALMLRPRFALAAVAVLLLAGILSGAHVGNDFARKDAQARYIAAVAPGVLH